MKNISNAVDQYLCNSCGACYAVCPEDAITYHETTGGYLFPTIDLNKCTYCGVCVKVCPGLGFGKSLKKLLPDEPFVGHVIGSYVGKSTNKTIFDNSQSGGVVTALLGYLFVTEKINAAIVAVMRSGIPPRGDVAIVTSREELLSAQKSKYTPIPMLKALKNLEKTDGQFALVGLGCHIHGMYNVLDMRPSLRNRIVIKIGLVCDRILTTTAFDFLIDSYADSRTSDSIIFRDKNKPSYPGNIVIGSTNGREVVLPPKRRMEIKEFFTPARCRICFDKMNVFSDITVGDPHGIKGVDRVRGESAVIVRTANGAALVASAQIAGHLDLKSVDAEKIFKGQMTAAKKESWLLFSSAWNSSFQGKLPDYGTLIPDVKYPTNRKIRKLLANSFKLNKFRSRSALISYYRRAIMFTAITDAPKKIMVKILRVFKNIVKRDKHNDS